MPTRCWRRWPTRSSTAPYRTPGMAVRKQRDGLSGFEIPFTPQVVELGLDEDGDPITAIVLSWGKQQREPMKRRVSRRT